LRNANSVATASVTITVIAWCENVELSAPTYALAAQSEYGKLGPISGPASAVAEAAKSLKKIPILKPYAMGTEVIANGIGSVARYFGFTNVPNTEAQAPFKPGSHYGMATTEISTPYEKLALDDKNELTIDPRVVGLPPKDEMVISNIIGRESFVTSTIWSATAVANASIFNAYVTPSMFDFDTSLVVSPFYAYYQTPMCHLSRLFTSWRGSIIFRFKFVCSPFHKGRVRITWDPKYNLSSITASSDVDKTLTSSFTKIVDLGETTEVEMHIPYMQALAFMTNYGIVKDAPVYMFTNGTTLPAVTDWSKFFNGTISVTVLNPQTSPVTSSDIEMLVFTRAGEDFVFANPREPPANFTFLNTQAQVVDIEPKTKETESLQFESNHQLDNLMKVHMGESIKSLRQLIHRQNYYCTFIGKKGNDPTTSAGNFNTWVFPRYPQSQGYNARGRGNFGYAKGLVTPTNFYPVTNTANSVFAMIAPLFIGARGGIVYNVNVDAPNPSSSVYLSRRADIDYTDNSTTTQIGWYNPKSWDIYNPSSLGSVTKYRAGNYDNGAAGRVLTNQTTQAGLMAHFPYYSPLRFTSSVGYQYSSENGTDSLSIPIEERTQNVALQVSTNIIGASVGNETSTVVDVYMMAGHDFSFYYFNCVPTFYYYVAEYGTTN
jgi:hypothetical protein